MEILNYDISSLALDVGIFFSGMSAILIIIITLVHWQTERHEKHSLAFHRANEPMVMSYLAGTMPEMSVNKSIDNEPLEAMHLLMELSMKLDPTEQSRLRPLFAALHGAEKETAALDSPHTKTRLEAAERLGYLQNDTSAEALLHALNDPVLAVKYCAARSLVAYGRVEFLEPTLLALDAENEINWFRLVEIACDYGQAAVPVLLAVIEHPEGKYSKNILNVAIRALGILKQPHVVKSLIPLLNHPDSSIRLNTAHALGDIGNPEAISPLAELIHDNDWTVRNNAIEALGKLHAETQIPILEEALTDSSWQVRFATAQALYSIGQPGIEKLKEILKSTHVTNTNDICSQVLSEHDILDNKEITS